LAGEITELRLFLTREPGVVLGEIATAGPSALTAVAVEIQEGSVTFRDDGTEPDRVARDGVFSAVFKFDTTREFQALRPGLKMTLGVLREPGQDTPIRRGPRDILPAADFIRDAERKTPEALKLARQEAERAAQLLEFEDPWRAAEALKIDIKTVPFLRLPGPRFDVFDPSRFKADHLFDFPIFATFPPPAQPVAIDHERSLLITATSVVEDSSRTFDACSDTGSPGGPWSFGHLMRELAHGTGLTPEQFTLNWLSGWQMPQEANGWIVNDPARGDNLRKLVIDTWQALSPERALNVDFFPARLLAIVNRPDLADRIGFGPGGSAGEGRFVFGLVHKDPNDGSCIPLRFTVILEYGVPARSCMDVKTWQGRWKDLDQFPSGDPGYNGALESITRAFTDHGSNPDQLPNMSSLGQIRTNEISLFAPWQLREFRLQDRGLLDLVTVKQTPDNSFESQPVLRAYIGANEADILSDRHVVPERFPGALSPFLGAVSGNLFQSFFWSAPDLNGLQDPVQARRKFSLATCNGCHAGETSTPFTHIGEEGRREMNEPAWTSPFLQGGDVTVPVTGGMQRYDDLTERKTALSKILDRSCFQLLAFEQLPFVH